MPPETQTPPTRPGQAQGPPILPPAVVIHGLADARAALAPARPVLLLSAQAAAAYAGAAWWRALIDLAHEAHPGRREPDALDCSDLPGRALEALAAGCPRIVLNPCPALPTIIERFPPGAVLTVRPQALDLHHPTALRRLQAWLDQPLFPPPSFREGPGMGSVASALCPQQDEPDPKGDSNTHIG